MGESKWTSPTNPNLNPLFSCSVQEALPADARRRSVEAGEDREGWSIPQEVSLRGDYNGSGLLEDIGG